MMAEQPLQVSRWEESEEIPLSAHLLLRRAKKRRRSGLLFHCAMRDSFRSVTMKWSFVSIEYEGETLCEMTNTTFKRPMFIDMPPGRRELTFRVMRAQKKRGTLFRQEVTLVEGSIFVALCEPIQPNVFYRKSPVKDTWKIGQVEPADPE